MHLACVWQYLLPLRCTALPIMPHDEMAPVSVWPWETLSVLTYNGGLSRCGGAVQTAAQNPLLNWDGSWRSSNHNKNTRSRHDRFLVYFQSGKMTQTGQTLRPYSTSTRTSHGSHGPVVPQQWSDRLTTDSQHSCRCRDDQPACSPVW